MTKRLFDVVLTLLAIPILAPLLAILAVLVAARMGRPILFRQDRIGRHGEQFSILKFRTMTDDRGPDGQLLPDELRMTPLGSWMRRLSLDELPEFWSVLSGKMSLVGPRPLPAIYEGHYLPHHDRRHEVRPGLTGLAQVGGRNNLSWKERLDLDVEYVDGRSMLLDIRILVKTVATIVRREGISAEGHATMSDMRLDPELNRLKAESQEPPHPNR